MDPFVRNTLLVAAGTVLMVVLIGGAWGVLAATAGPVNPAILPGWYLPPGGGERADMLVQLGKELYDPVEKPGLQPPAGFPALSRYSASGRYERRNSTDTYRVVVWYFDNRDEFTRAENRLLEHLLMHGEISPVTLDMTRQHQDFQDVQGENEIVWCPDIPLTLAASAYKSGNVSGYFFAIKKPLLHGREDYFLAGYLAETGNCSSQGPYLRDLVARGYYNENGSYDGLHRET